MLLGLGYGCRTRVCVRHGYDSIFVSFSIYLKDRSVIPMSECVGHGYFWENEESKQHRPSPFPRSKAAVVKRCIISLRAAFNLSPCPTPHDKLFPLVWPPFVLSLFRSSFFSYSSLNFLRICSR